MSYSYSPALNFPSVLPLNAVCIACPTLERFKPKDAILSLSKFT